MKVTIDNYKDVSDYLYTHHNIYCTADQLGVDIEYDYFGESVTAFIPWGYSVNINDDGYPEIKKEV